MSNLIKFIHTADLHLGRELSSNINGNKELMSLFSNAAQLSFKNMLKLALEENVDFILIAGDLYDRKARSIKSSQFFLEQCQILNEAGIDLFIISGNHDPAGSKNEVFELPANVHYFSSENVEEFEYRKNGKLTARILGQSYREKFESRTMYNYYTPTDNSVYNIALMHTALNKNNSRYVPVTKSELLTKNHINYWALGHLHQYQKINENPLIFFPGTLQGRNIDEKSNKGVIIVEVDSNFKSSSKFVSTAPVIFDKLEIDLEKLSKLENISDLQQIINQKIKILEKNINKKNLKLKFKVKAVILRVILKGRTKIHKYVKNNREELQETILKNLRNRSLNNYPAFWLHSIILRTAEPLAKLIDFKENNPLYKELKELINASLTDPKLNKEMLANWGEVWKGDSSAEDRENHKFYADKKLQKEILEEVEKIIISELLGAEK